jgi:hypothetical protein
MNRYRAAQRGWTNTGGYSARYLKTLPPSTPVRTNCRWNDREDYDLCEAFTRGTSIRVLAERHARARTAILMRIERCLDGATRYMTNPTGEK